MRINREYEPEIGLRDLLFHVLYRWRSIIVAALIGALLLGAYQYLSLQRAHRDGGQTTEEKQYEIDLQNYRDSLKNTRNNIRTYSQLIKEKNDYLDQSIYMTLDSQNEWVASKRFFIKMDQSVMDALPESAQEDPADYTASFYTSTLKSGLDAGEMEALLGTGRMEYVDELVSISGDYASNTITLQVIGGDEETVSRQLDYFAKRLETVCKPMAESVGAHTLTLVSESVISRTDANLSAKQDEINQQLLEWQEELKNQRETLNGLEEDEEPTPPGTHIKKFAAIGFILGAFLLAAFYAFRYVVDGKLHSVSDLSERYELPVYGQYASSRARRSGKGLDKLLEKWEFKHAVTDDGAVDSAVCALLNERFAGKSLLLTGTLSEQKLNAYANRLKDKLGGACRLSARGDLPLNTGAVAAVKDADAVILVEVRHESGSQNIERAADLLGISQADVAGCIIL